MSALDEALGELGLTTDDWRERAAHLDTPTRALYRAMLRSISASGSMPDSDWIRREAIANEVDGARTIEWLVDSDLIAVSSEGNVVAAYPFSGHQTAHRVELESGPPLYAMCAIDALGIPFMLGANARVLSHDVRSGERIAVIFASGTVRFEPAETVVFVGARGEGGSIADRCCGFINFFTSAESARMYRETNPDLRGVVLNHDEALDFGKRIFGNLLRD